MHEGQCGLTETDPDDGNPKTDGEVGQDVTPFVRARDRHCGDVGDVVEAAVDDEGRAADTKARADGKTARWVSSGQPLSRHRHKM